MPVCLSFLFFFEDRGKTDKYYWALVAWPDTRNTATVRELKEKVKGVQFKTPEGMIEGEEGVRALTGLPFR